MRLPHSERATVRPDKLTKYVLNFDHPEGKHKARVFAAALGITANDPEPLLHALREAAVNLEPVPGKTDQYGARYSIDFSMTGPFGEVLVRSAWIVRGDLPPDLVTCYIL